MPQASGAAYALKLDDERQGDCVICYFGDGEWSDRFRSIANGIENPIWTC